MNISDTFGGIDIYLFDQLQKGRLEPGSHVLDAGCGNGRNLFWLVQNGYSVTAVDRSPEAVNHVQELVARLAPESDTDIRTASVESLPFEADIFDTVICCAVLHFAQDEGQFNTMVDELWRVLKPGGLFFSRLATATGLEHRLEHIDERWYRLPDGSERFLADETMLLEISKHLNGQLADPIKATIVQGMRSMTTWSMWKEH